MSAGLAAGSLCRRHIVLPVAVRGYFQPPPGTTSGRRMGLLPVVARDHFLSPPGTTSSRRLGPLPAAARDHFRSPPGTTSGRRQGLLPAADAAGSFPRRRFAHQSLLFVATRVQIRLARRVQTLEPKWLTTHAGHMKHRPPG